MGRSHTAPEIYCKCKARHDTRMAKGRCVSHRPFSFLIQLMTYHTRTPPLLQIAKNRIVTRIVATFDLIDASLVVPLSEQVLPSLHVRLATRQGLPRRGVTFYARTLPNSWPRSDRGQARDRTPYRHTRTRRNGRCPLARQHPRDFHAPRKDILFPSGSRGGIAAGDVMVCAPAFLSAHSASGY